MVYRDPGLAQGVDHVIRDGTHVRVGRSGRDHEEVRRVADAAQVEDDHVLRLAVGQRVDDQAHVAQVRLSLSGLAGAGVFLTRDGGIHLG